MIRWWLWYFYNGPPTASFEMCWHPRRMARVRLQQMKKNFGLGQ